MKLFDPVLGFDLSEEKPETSKKKPVKNKKLPMDYWDDLVEGKVSWQRKRIGEWPIKSEWTQLKKPVEKKPVKKKVLPLKSCRTCKKAFYPKRKSQTVCTGGPDCHLVLGYPPENCKFCSSEFRPTKKADRFCNQKCKDNHYREYNTNYQRKRRTQKKILHTWNSLSQGEVSKVLEHLGVTDRKEFEDFVSQRLEDLAKKVDDVRATAHDLYDYDVYAKRELDNDYFLCYDKLSA